MRIRSLHLRGFKRFTDLTIQGLPQAARLVVLAGPNGCGKSSLFDAMHSWHRLSWKGGGTWVEAYHVKQADSQPLRWNQSVEVQFFDPQPETQDAKLKAIYVRSAYRNDPEFQLESLQRAQPVLQEHRFNRMIDNDATVRLNYQRLVAQGVEDLYESGAGGTTFEEYRKQAIGELVGATDRLFPGLKLHSLGNPLASGTFKFGKGQSRAFLYMNLSGGEKAAFDLLLDIAVKKREFDDTVFLIDEPEAHMNTRLQAGLLDEMLRLLPHEAQLWVATHSIGMMRRAREMADGSPGAVVFLDMDGRDFDISQVVEPVRPTRAFWQRVLNVALDDLASLVAPARVVICEGKPLGAGGKREAIDATCYDTIFADEFPDTRFLSAGSANEVETDRRAFIEAIQALVQGSKVIRLIDRDDLSPAEVETKREQGLRILSRRQLENYLYDDAVLTRLCMSVGRPEEAVNLIADKAKALEASTKRGNPPDDVKSASGEIYNAARTTLALTGCGSNASEFMRSTLAPLLTSDLDVYKELRRDIFGEGLGSEQRSGSST